MLVMIGAVLPDIVSINYLTSYFGHDIFNTVLPFHTLLGACLMAGIISSLFSRPLVVFKWIVFGTLTHFVLDSLLIHTVGGMVLLFPVWIWDFQLGILKSTDWMLPGVVILASLVFLVLSSGKITWRRGGSLSRKI